MNVRFSALVIIIIIIIIIIITIITIIIITIVIIVVVIIINTVDVKKSLHKKHLESPFNQCSIDSKHAQVLYIKAASNTSSMACNLITLHKLHLAAALQIYIIGFLIRYGLWPYKFT